ncbi:MAG: hypothetical protein Q4D51_03540 [Eubacteriales bacterium]|nr:hypothetical protein [Eubacteriales bacterium]
MDANTIELLKECSSGCKMAIDSISQIRDYVQDAKLRELLMAYNQKHVELQTKIRQLLGQCDEEDKDPSLMAEWCSKMKISMKMNMHPDDHQVAKLMMDGCNMGIQSVSEYVNKYPDASPQAQDVAKELIKAEEDFMIEMKEFV